MGGLCGYLFLVLFGRIILATESLLLVSPVPSWPYLFQPKDQRTLPCTVKLEVRGHSDDVTLVRQTVWRDPQLTSTTAHSASFLPLDKQSVTSDGDSDSNYPMETSMGVGCRVTMSVGVSQEEPV